MPDAFEIRPNFVQQDDQLTTLACAQTIDGSVRKLSDLALEDLMNAAALAGWLERDTPAVGGVGLRFKQFLILKAPDQPGKLSLVLAQMRDKISQGRAGVPNKETENLALHVR